MYTQSITRNHRTAFVLAIDCSGSMNEEVRFGHRRMTKAAAVAAVANRLLFELTERARRSDGLRDYYDIALIGYGGSGLHPLVGDRLDFLTLPEVAARGTHPTATQSEYRLPDGSAALLDEVPVPVWITPQAEGETPMYEALLAVRDLVARWTARPEHAASFPPVVFNITDGEASDCDDAELREVCSQIRTLHTDDGAVLLINIHIASGTDERALLFPTPDEASYGNRYAALLYDCSSEMPAAFDAAIRDLRGGGQPPFRGMSYNASMQELLTILNIGSISVKTE